MAANKPRIFITYQILNVAGHSDFSHYSLQTTYINDSGGFDPDGAPFERSKVNPKPFDSSPHEKRYLFITLREKNSNDVVASGRFMMREILRNCHSRPGGFYEFTLPLDPFGEISLTAQVHPRRDRALMRRGAHKVAKVYCSLGHRFAPFRPEQLIRCWNCNKAILGLEIPGLECQFCKIPIHECCIGQQTPRCPRQEVPHNFLPKTFIIPKRCALDGQLMFAWSSTAKCDSCNIFVHKKCGELAPFCSKRAAESPTSQAAAADDNYYCYYDYNYSNYEYHRLRADPEVLASQEDAPEWLRNNPPFVLNNFQILKLIGQGSFGKVFLSRYLGSSAGNETPMIFALKAVRKDLNSVNFEATIAERNVLKLASNSPFLIHMLCTFSDDSHLFYVLEFVACGALIFHIQYGGAFDIQRATFYAAEVTCALEFLHRNRIIYRDLKSENVMLDRSGHIRLIDFGLATSNLGADNLTRTICGTLTHIAPEIIKGSPYSFAVDWWSFGAFLFEMLSGYMPFLTVSTYAEMTEQYEDPTLPDYTDFLENPVAVDILRRLFDRSPQTRLASPEIRSHPFFSNINWEILETGRAEPPELLPPPFEHEYSRISVEDSVLDLNYFERDFLNEPATLSRNDQRVARVPGGALFGGFSFINFEFRPRD